MMHERLGVIIGAHDPYQGALCEASLRRNGLTVVKFGAGKRWPGNYRDGKTIPQLECVRSIHQMFSHILFTDSADSMAMCGSDEILSKFGTFPGGIVVSGEKNCHPDGQLRGLYPGEKGPWSFVNSGGWIGRSSDVLAALECIASLPWDDDQRCWTLAYLAYAFPMAVDHQCRIFQTMRRQSGEFSNVSGRVYNRATGQFPSIVHWNGIAHSDVAMSLIRPFNPGLVTQMDIATEARYVDRIPVGAMA